MSERPISKDAETRIRRACEARLPDLGTQLPAGIELLEVTDVLLEAMLIGAEVGYAEGLAELRRQLDQLAEEKRRFDGGR